jgi:hypothetical protein
MHRDMAELLYLAHKLPGICGTLENRPFYAHPVSTVSTASQGNACLRWLQVSTGNAPAPMFRRLGQACAPKDDDDAEHEVNGCEDERCESLSAGPLHWSINMHIFLMLHVAIADIN